ncbi:MAG: DUF975 family protein [Ruminococcus sp.]|nr:DUF975 family protein [Ruminococcus sp.]MCM1382882.1 DUF975 family protein [Muribaculaceae bacterium]MCM1480635.1 DUF975 family protein [Muribaculaceae bacterium]
MKNPKELKKHARERLVCCWGESCAVFFIIAGELSAVALALILAYDYLMNFSRSDFPVWLAAGITAALAVSLWLAVAPFAYGVRWYRIQQIRGNAVFARGMFSCYASLKKMLQVLKLNSMLTLRRIPAFLLIFGGIAAEFHLAGKPESSALPAVAVFAAVTGLLLYLILGLKYAPVPYLYALKPDASPKNLIAESKRLMKNNYRYLVETMLSMAGWLAPCLLIFPTVFIFPYTQMVYTAAINEIITNEERNGLAENELLANNAV